MNNENVQVIIPKSELDELADIIKEKSNSTRPLTVKEMKNKVRNMGLGGEGYDDTYVLEQINLLQENKAGKEELQQVYEELNNNKANKTTVESIQTEIGNINQAVTNHGATLEELGTNKADKSEIPTKTSQLTNNSGYLVASDISNKADKNEIPTKTSQLSNDSGFLTQNDKQDIINQVLDSIGSPVYGLVDDNNNIVLTGTLADGTYSIKYEMVDGSKIDIGNLNISSKPKYTNLANPSSSEWGENTRLSISSGNTSTLAGHTTTNFIPCKMGDTLRVKGLIMTGYLTNTSDASDTAKIISYTSAKAKIVGLYGLERSGNAEDYGLKLSTSGDIKTYTIQLNNNGEQKTTSSCAYIRIDGKLMSGYTKDDVIITINEPIE